MDENAGSDDSAGEREREREKGIIMMLQVRSPGAKCCMPKAKSM
jgi:hypothetical protein